MPHRVGTHLIGEAAASHRVPPKHNLHWHIHHQPGGVYRSFTQSRKHIHINERCHHRPGRDPWGELLPKNVEREHFSIKQTRSLYGGRFPNENLFLVRRVNFYCPQRSAEDGAARKRRSEGEEDGSYFWKCFFSHCWEKWIGWEGAGLGAGEGFGGVEL